MHVKNPDHTTMQENSTKKKPETQRRVMAGEKIFATASVPGQEAHNRIRVRTGREDNTVV